MKCVDACVKNNAKTNTIPAVSGAAAAAALIGISYIGTISQPVLNTDAVQTDTSEVTEQSISGKYKDGTYTGSAYGYRGQTTVSVTVSGGMIININTESYEDDREFFERAENKVIPEIISAQDVQVDTVSGATFSSKGIINAVENALGDQLLQGITESSTSESSESTDQESSETNDERVKRIFSTERHHKKHEEETYYEHEDQNSAEESSEQEEEAEISQSPADEENSDIEEQEKTEQSTASSDAALEDGVYTGSGTGFRGTTTVEVTVDNGKISNITVTSYQDDKQFFSRAESGIISSIISSQSTDVDTVSGATFSSNGLIEAVSDALGREFTNPNSTMSHGRGRH